MLLACATLLTRVLLFLYVRVFALFVKLNSGGLIQLLSYFFQHSAASTSDQLWWPFPELNDDSLEMAVRHGDLCEEDDKDWPFAE